MESKKQSNGLGDTKMRLPGHSGCKFIFNEEDGTVIKSTEDSKYPPDRFERQIEKQQQFYQDHLGDGPVKTPFVFGLFDCHHHCSAVMELVYGLDPIEFLQIASDIECLRFFKKIAGIVNEYLSDSEYKEIDFNIVAKKYFSVCNKLPMDQVQWLDIHWLEFAKERSPIVLPVGPCHGDLTLSNMILDESHIVLLDFMETFLDTPLQDIVKLRQDTKHGWTVFRYPGHIKNMEKLKSRLFALDQYLILEWPRMHDWQYDLFQFLNLARILPYAKEQKTIDWVFEQIGKIR
jgi:hypothetical protein